jgi:acetyltransferase EpsM
MKNFFFIGSGGYFREQFQWFRDFVIKKKIKNYNVAGIIDDVNYKAIKDNYSGLKIFKSKDIKYSTDKYLILSIGDPNTRNYFIKKFSKFNFFNLIHPSAIVSTCAKIGKGTIVSPLSIIAGNAVMGDFNNLNFGTMLSHDCNVGANNTFSPGTKIMGHCSIGNNNFFGVDSKMIPSTAILNNNIIGANCTIIDNFKSNSTLVGTPAKLIKKK